MSYSKQYCFALLALLIITVFSCDTEGPGDYKSHFIKYYGEDGDQESKDFVVNDDGSVVIVGTTTFNGIKKVYLIKADEQGNQLWSLKFWGGTNESGQAVERIVAGTDIGNYLVVSHAVKSAEDSLAIRLTVVSESGDSIKSFLIDRYESQEANSLTVLPSGSYYLTGKVKNADTLNVELPGFDLEDSFDMIIGNNYALVSSERTGGSTLASGIKIIEKSSSTNYALYSDELKVEPDTPLDPTDGLYEVNFVFRKFDKNTNNKTSFYAGTPRLNEYMADIDQSFSGVSMAVGTQYDPTINTYAKLYAATINSSYSKPLIASGEVSGAPDRAEGVSVAHSADVDFFWVLGNEVAAGGGDRNIWVGKVEVSNLQTSFSRTFGSSSNDDTGSAILQLENGDLLILATMELVNQKKIALIRIKPNGQF